MSSTRRPYPFHLIEPKWQTFWGREQTFRAFNPGERIPRGHPFGARHGLAGACPTAAELPPKYYILDMFPYPSGAGLHVGHPEGYTATDILARYRRSCGWHVLHPMGWDAFGLPAEQYALKTGQHPRKTTETNIATFKRQIQSLGFSYDWSREVDTTDPRYFRWTQWIFLQLYGAWFNPDTNRAEPIRTLTYPADLATEDQRRAYRDARRLAYIGEVPVNWCPELGTVLANEEVVDGKSEVGGYAVVRRPMRQWMLRITAYAERLLQDLATIDWSESLKEMQRNWIGRSEGAEVEFRIQQCDARIVVFTTRPDTLFGATYMVLSPEHPLVNQITTPKQREAVEAYRASVAVKSELERSELAKEKTGVFTGAFAFNPAHQQAIPIWIADYVLMSYGTGAIMAVPGHDTRDLEFATKFNLPIMQVVEPPDPNTDWRGFVGEGRAVNSAGPGFSLNGLATPEAKQRMTAWLESQGLGRPAVNYKLRDWLFSRQRYWGEPFPIVWRDGHHEALPLTTLPVLPPELQHYEPTPEGEEPKPPLARAQDWMHLPDGSTREANTMPQWAGSCWYYLRYLDPRNEDAFVAAAAERYWMGAQGQVGSPKLDVGSSKELAHETANAAPSWRTHLPDPDAGKREPAPTSPGVDLYVGGTEHAVLHLLYARFWHKVLFDLGHVSTPEPFFKLVNQGLILGEDGQKMSKSRGNVVNPDDILRQYGADAFRLYEMFLGPLEMVKPWSTKGVEGVYRFLGRVWRLFVEESSETEFEQRCAAEADRAAEFLEAVRLSGTVQDVAPTPTQLKTLAAAIKKVTEDLEGLRFNTAISALMVFVKEALSWEVKPVAVLRPFLQLLAPFAPHLAEELWAQLAATVGSAPTSLSYEPWPQFDPAILREETLEIPVQVNGKLRDRIRVPADADASALEAAALAAGKVQALVAGKPVKKVVVVPKKMVNVVVG